MFIKIALHNWHNPHVPNFLTFNAPAFYGHLHKVNLQIEFCCLWKKKSAALKKKVKPYVLTTIR